MTDDWRRPSPRLWAARRLEVYAAAAVALAAGVPAAWLAAGAGVGLIVLVGVLAVAGCAWAGLRGRYRSWRYRERADDLVVSRGVLVRRTSVIPYGRMQFVDVTAGPIERVFGLATVRMHTAAAASDGRIPGLAREEAERLRDQLARLGEAQAAGL